MYVKCNKIPTYFDAINRQLDLFMYVNCSLIFGPCMKKEIESSSKTHFINRMH